MSWLSKVAKSAVGAVGSFLGGPIGGAVLGVADTLLTNRSNEDAVNAQNAANAALWREQAAYNTPANQVARLRDAGLNPNLFYSQGNTGNMTSAPTMQANRYNYNFAQAVDKAAVIYQIRNLKEQNEKLAAEQSAIKANARKANVEADYREAVLNFYKKYGRFPDQNLQTSLLSFIQNHGEDFLGSLDFAKEVVRKKVLEKLPEAKANLRELKKEVKRIVERWQTPKKEPVEPQEYITYREWR